jgi:acetyltransferase
MTRFTTSGMQALFEPRGVAIAGASTHPGKFGFVALHNLLANGYRGAVYATQRDGAEVLGIKCQTDFASLPAGPLDLVVVCTPPGAVHDVLTQAAQRGARAAFVVTAGYQEAGAQGALRQKELVALADSLDMALVGPNGQGVVSTPASLCAQIVAPYPPPGPISIASQSGNFVSSYMNIASQHGVGVARAVSVGNSASIDVLDMIDYFSTDDASRVGLTYLEGIGDGATFVERVRPITSRMPVVLVKGGRTGDGQRAATSHTGSLATDDRIFDGIARQAGLLRARSIESAYLAAASLATQPALKGPRVAVVTTVGGWGVLAADSVAANGLQLAEISPALRETLDRVLPARWSKNNPIDMAGGETRDTVPEVLAAVAADPAVDAVLFLGIGIQSNQAAAIRNGPFYPDFGTERIVAFHERQDERYAVTAREVALASQKPVLVASELANADPDNAGPRAVRASGTVCYPSGELALEALGHMWTDRRWRARRGLA